MSGSSGRSGADVELIGESPEVLALQTEIGTLERRLEQRELALAALNRRLLDLERGYAYGAVGATGGPRSMMEMQATLNLQDEELRRARGECEALRAEINRVYATKLFRLARPARRIYAVLRGG